MNRSIRVGDSYEAISREAAQRVLAALRQKPDLLLCAAGGSTPRRTYEVLVENYTRNPKTFEALRVVKLDEWGGIAMDDPGSCETQLRRELVNPLRLTEDRYLSFASNPADREFECDQMRQQLEKQGAIDLCVLGLGANGHIGMNEPAAALKPEAHIAQLTEVSLRHPMLASSCASPTYGLTLGMAEIMSSREILLLVSGASKRQPLQRLMTRKITTEFPASFLWLHPNWMLLCDPDAAEE